MGKTGSLSDSYSSHCGVVARCSMFLFPIAPFGDPSPMALVEGRSRSRRCLLFASPCGAARSRRLPAVRSSSWRLHKESCQNRGKCELRALGACAMTETWPSVHSLQACRLE